LYIGLSRPVPIIHTTRTQHVGFVFVLEELRESPVIVQHARNRGAFHRLETVYYDTPERLLFQHGMSLRVRRSGKHFIRTLKLLPNSAQPLRPRQWEAPVDGIRPDLAWLPADEVGDPMTTLTNDALVPVFATNVRRLGPAREWDVATHRCPETRRRSAITCLASSAVIWPAPRTW